MNKTSLGELLMGKLLKLEVFAGRFLIAKFMWCLLDVEFMGSLVIDTAVTRRKYL